MSLRTLYDEASLWMTPSGYEDGKLYSELPVPVYGAELVTNGTFDSDSDWTKGTGWTISGGTANCDGTQTGTTNLNNTVGNGLVNGKKYRVVYTISSYASGSIRIKLGNSGYGVYHSSNGTYSQDLVAEVTTFPTAQFNADANFVGSIDNVSVQEIVSSGDFTFSRGSNLAATRVGPNGLIEKGRENLLTYSNDFSQWTKINTTTTSGQSGYDGSSDATEVSFTAGSSRAIGKGGLVTSIVNFSVYVKAGTHDVIQFTPSNSATTFANFDISASNPATGNTSGLVVDSSIEDIGGGWYRCSAVLNNSGSGTMWIWIVDSLTSGRAAAVSTDGTFFVQDAQLEQGLVATEVISTGATTGKAGILEDLPRLDYSGGASCPSLLLEPSRTNNIPQSEYIKALASVQNMTLLNNASVNPQGLQYATEAVPTANTATHIFFKSGMGNAANTFTQSIYAKANGYNFCFIRFDLPTIHAWFDLENGVVGETQSGITSTIEDAGNGWYRCTATLTTTQYANAVIGVSNQDGATNFAANGTSSVLFWGWQSELGSYPTSYIPTMGSAVTRSLDTSSLTGVSDLIGQEQGTIIIDFKRTFKNDNYNRYLVIDDNYSSVYRTGIFILPEPSFDGKLYINVRNNSTSVFDHTYNDTTNTNLKIAVAYSSGDIDYFINGVKVNSSTTTFSFSHTLERIMISGSNQENNQLLVFKTKLTDSECIALTSL